MKIIKVEEGTRYSLTPETVVLYYGIDLDFVFDPSIQQYRANSLTGFSFNIVNDNIYELNLEVAFYEKRHYFENSSSSSNYGEYSEDY